MVSKAQVVEHIQQLLNNKQAFLEDEMKSLQATAAGETKSSMGDKYETARAQVHLEMEKFAKRLQDIRELKTILQKAEQPSKCNSAGFGNLVSTSNGLYFIGCGLGKIEIDAHAVFAVSPASPIAKALLQKAPPDSITIHGTSIEILRIEG